MTKNYYTMGWGECLVYVATESDTSYSAKYCFCVLQAFIWWNGMLPESGHD